MRLARNFDPIGPDEVDTFAFDFAKDLGAETIVSTSWQCSVAAASAGSDATPAARLIGGAQISGTMSLQLVGSMVAGVSYTLEALVVTATRTLALCAGVDCKAC